MSGRWLLELRAVEGPLAGRTHRLDAPGLCLLGRAADCRLRVDGDPDASRYHCAIELAPPRALVRDLASRNGTWVNERRVDGAGAVVRHGDWVRAGRSTFLVVTTGGEDATVRGPAEPPPGEGFDAPPGYALLALLTGSGRGEVWRARRDDGTAAVVKSLPAEDGAEAVVVASFLREIDALRRLRHPRVVALLDHGMTARGWWFAMEHCDGGSLHDLAAARGGTLPVDEALGHVLGALEGLAFAHREGFVHRDVKPANVLLDRGSARLGDFGLAKRFARAGLSGVSALGSYAGTLAFMPREQLTDYATAGPRSDVWSAAATLYRLVAGAPPREEGAARDAVRRVLETPATPLRERAPTVPAALAAVIDGALADHPARRPSDAGALAEALRRAAG